MKQNKMWEYAKTIGTALIIALVIRTSVVQAYKIPSGSMIPTLLVGDYLLANKFIYGPKIPFTHERLFTLMKPERGDIVIFPSPEDPDKDLIKRIVAVGGDMIAGKDKQLFVNGKPINEPYVQHEDQFLNPLRDNFGPCVVPEGKIFAVGDNRDNSYDSRFWGFVDIRNIKGKAFLLYWSWDSSKHFPRFTRVGHLIR
jgi:signal peptidase I